MAKNEKHHMEKRENIWYFVATKNGKRYHEPLSSNFRDAKLMRDEKLAELNNHGKLLSNIDKHQPEADDKLFGEIAQLWAQ